MLNLYALFIFIIGLSVGSFLNVLIFRVDNLKSVAGERSKCLKCGHKLSWQDLIPLLSFALLRGKCRYCGAKISWQYPLVEFFVAISFLVLFLFFGLSWSLLFYIIVFSLLAVVFVIDLKTEMTQELFVWIALVLAVVGGWYFGGFTFQQGLWGAIIGGGLFAVLVYASGEKWMGSGDIKIGAIMGFLLGYPVVLLGLFLAFLTGAIIGLIYIQMKKKTIKASLPFAPFLIFATFVAIILGNEIVNWYLGAYIY